MNGASPGRHGQLPRQFFVRRASKPKRKRHSTLLLKLQLNVAHQQGVVLMLTSQTKRVMFNPVKLPRPVDGPAQSFLVLHSSGTTRSAQKVSPIHPHSVTMVPPATRVVRFLSTIHSAKREVGGLWSLKLFTPAVFPKTLAVLCLASFSGGFGIMEYIKRKSVRTQLAFPFATCTSRF